MAGPGWLVAHAGVAEAVWLITRLYLVAFCRLLVEAVCVGGLPLSRYRLDVGFVYVRVKLALFLVGDVCATSVSEYFCSDCAVSMGSWGYSSVVFSARGLPLARVEQIPRVFGVWGSGRRTLALWIVSFGGRLQGSGRFTLRD